MSAPWLALGCSYLVGSVPTAYVVVRLVARADVRTVGSGNVGATNVTRAAGAGWGLVVFLLDALKGVLATQGFAVWFEVEPRDPAQLACGIAAVMGHVFPLFLGLRGGKGVATTIGVLVSTVPTMAAAVLAVWAAGFALTRYVSVGSLAAALAIPVAQILWGRVQIEQVFGAALGLLLVWTHRANIQRLAAGTEHRAGRAGAPPRPTGSG